MILNTIAWLSVALIFLLIEVGHPGVFYFLSFSLGSFLAAFISFYIDNLFIQALFFFIGFLLFLKILKKYAYLKRVPDEKSAFYKLKNQIGIVKKIIKPNIPGEVKVAGQIWSARSNEIINPQEEVEIVDIQGCHLVVKRFNSRKE